MRFVVLNVVAQPHPDGGYYDIFDNAGKQRQGVQYYGERYATLSPVSTIRNDVFTGRLATWIEPDRTAKTIEVTSLDQRAFDESGIVIPRDVGLNSKVFDFAFNVKNHLLILALEGDDSTISAKQGRTAIENILNRSKLDWVEEISVYIRTKTDALDKFFSIPEIRKVEIDLRRPNPDDYSGDEEDILREMEEENSKRRRLEIVKAPKRVSLQLIPRHRAMANVAQNNGFVSVAGRDEYGEKVEFSTKEMPDIVHRGTSDDSIAAIARNIAESFTVQGDD